MLGWFFWCDFYIPLLETNIPLSHLSQTFKTCDSVARGLTRILLLLPYSTPSQCHSLGRLWTFKSPLPGCNVCLVSTWLRPLAPLLLAVPMTAIPICLSSRVLAGSLVTRPHNLWPDVWVCSSWPATSLREPATSALPLQLLLRYSLKTNFSLLIIVDVKKQSEAAASSP